MAEDKPKKRVLKQDSIKDRAEKAKAKSEKSTGAVRKLLRIIFTPVRFVLRPFLWLGRKIVPRYFKNSFAELKLVTWPNRKETRKLTTAVLMFAIVLGATVSLVDLGLDKVFKKVILKQ